MRDIHDHDEFNTQAEVNAERSYQDHLDGFCNPETCHWCWEEEGESQSSKHCDLGYMNDLRFGGY